VKITSLFRLFTNKQRNTAKSATSCRWRQWWRAVLIG